MLTSVIINFLVLLLCTPFQSHALVIPSSESATGTSGITKLAALVAYTEAKADSQLIQGQPKHAACCFIGDDDVDSPLTYSSARGRALIDSGGRLICCDEMKSEGSCEFCDNDGDDACGAVGIGNWKCKYTSVLSGPSDIPACLFYMQLSGTGETAIVHPLRGVKHCEPISSTNTTKGGRRMIKKRFARVIVGAVQGKTTETDSPASKDSSKSTHSDDSKNSLGAEVIVAIVIPTVAIVVTIVVGWWEPQQVLWFLTCSLRGNKSPRDRQSLWRKALKKLRFWR